MKKTVFILFLLLFLGFSAFAQYQKNSWMFSGSVFVNLGGLNIETRYPGPPASTKEINLIAGDVLVGTRNTFFVIENLGVGLDIQTDIIGDGWEPTGDYASDFTYQYNGQDLAVDDYKESLGSSSVFIGPLVRYYIPIGKFVAIYPEASFGYRLYGEIDYISGKAEFDPAKGKQKFEYRKYTKAGGFGYNLGAGIAFRLSEQFALDVSARHGGGMIKGDTQDDSDYPESAAYTKMETYDTDVKFGTIDLMIGFQIYIGN